MADVIIGLGLAGLEGLFCEPLQLLRARAGLARTGIGGARHWLCLLSLRMSKAFELLVVGALLH